MSDYSKKTFEDGCRTWEQLAGAKSVGQMIEIQTQFAKRAFDNYMSELSKLGDMYASLARNAYKPVQQEAARRTAQPGI